MTTILTEFDKWIKRGNEINAYYLIIAIDTQFDQWEDFPVYVFSEEEFDKEFNYYESETTYFKVKEVIKLKLNRFI